MSRWCHCHPTCAFISPIRRFPSKPHKSVKVKPLWEEQNFTNGRSLSLFSFREVWVHFGDFPSAHKKMLPDCLIFYRLSVKTESESISKWSNTPMKTNQMLATNHKEWLITITFWWQCKWMGYEHSHVFWYAVQWKHIFKKRFLQTEIHFDL